MKQFNVVMLPGLLCDAAVFNRQVDALADAGGITVADLTAGTSIEAMASDVLARAPKGRFVLVGLSMGGYVALEIMRRAPERVSALALIGCRADPDTAAQTARRESLIARAAHSYPRVIESLMSSMVLPENTGTPEVGSAFQSMANSLGVEVFVRQERAIMGRQDSRPVLPGIQCPTLLIAGQQDLIAPPETQREMAAAIPGARLALIERCGHLATLEQPDQVAVILRDWLAELARADAKQAGSPPLNG